MKILDSLKLWLKASGHWVYPLIALGLAALVYEGVAQLLKKLDLHQVWLSVQATPPSALMLALVATGVSYVALMGYDFGSLRLVGAKIPAKKTAKTAFMAYAMGNSLGAAMLTGGALRMRHYMAEGASAGQVARAIVINALSFGLGIGVLGALGIVWQSDKVGEAIHLPALLLQVLAVVFLVCLGLWGAMGHRLQGLRLLGRTLPLHPGHRFLVLQLVVSCLDIAASGFALWILLPDGAVSFSLFIVYFAIAIALGVLSHVPGGLGVFEALMLLCVGKDVGPEALTAALLVFRGVYFLIPLMLAFLLLGFEEWWMARRSGQKP
ncbi:MAG: bifunctional lysylphosphatidylglycerol flippase/synthetase MprF [Pseudomonadota bacterium]|jgi:phosphatidylglycerol lysyltransferase